jgi:hypothetical protein
LKITGTNWAHPEIIVDAVIPKSAKRAKKCEKLLNMALEIVDLPIKNCDFQYNVRPPR